ncbi:hypothetical protein BU16DRAFT_522264 [Lophium mytilinum]|uniref:Carboxymuconolactone decarboxylase-like domain-containing protein n=1 Tax=Lophium mytilinum TaxID=390894 RepID=A0A6A6RCV0_9PEZI|nr:hypothetical protein BU16DRAFT_522264 [Lophium mytilinum]
MSPPQQLPAVVSPSLLASLRDNAQLPAHAWYIVAGVTLSAINRPEEIPKIFTSAIEHGVGSRERGPPVHAEQLRIARKLREGLIKSLAVVGMPKTINALYALKDATPASLLDEPTGASPSARPAEVYSTPTAEILLRGQTYFEHVYGKVSTRVMGQMDGSGTEDLGVVARLLYGYVLSNESVLTAVETSFVMLAGLIPQDVNPQLKGHLRGALNSGATVEEVRAVREAVICICEAAGMTRLDPDAGHGWGWREEVENV